MKRAIKWCRGRGHLRELKLNIGPIYTGYGYASGQTCIFIRQAFSSSSGIPSVYKYWQTDGLSVKTN